KQTKAKVSAAFSAISPFAMKAAMMGDGHGAGVTGALVRVAQGAAEAFGGPLQFGLALAGAGALLAAIFYRRNRAKEAAPIAFLFFREVHDPVIEAVRDRIVEALTARLAGSEDAIRAVFANPTRPVRACAAELMALGKLDIPTWVELSGAAISAAGLRG